MAIRTEWPELIVATRTESMDAGDGTVKSVWIVDSEFEDLPFTSCVPVAGMLRFLGQRLEYDADYRATCRYAPTKRIPDAARICQPAVERDTDGHPIEDSDNPGSNIYLYDDDGESYMGSRA